MKNESDYVVRFDTYFTFISDTAVSAELSIERF